MSDAFSYLSVLLSIIIGLAIAEILQGYGTLLLSRHDVKLYAPPIIWSVMFLVLATHFWWASFGLAKRESWSFAGFSAVLAQSIMLFIALGFLKLWLLGDPWGPLTLTFFAFFTTMTLIGLLSERPRVHEILAPVMAAGIAVFITIMFARLK